MVVIIWQALSASIWLSASQSTDVMHWTFLSHQCDRTLLGPAETDHTSVIVRFWDQPRLITPVWSYASGTSRDWSHRCDRTLLGPAETDHTGVIVRFWDQPRLITPVWSYASGTSRDWSHRCDRTFWDQPRLITPVWSYASGTSRDWSHRCDRTLLGPAETDHTGDNK